MSRGSIVTFYSYKGGVGRTFLLASVAVVLAEWGRKVLCIDWDLEAPGLSHYFRRWMSQKHGGVVDLTESISRSETPEWRNHISRVQFRKDLVLDFIPAGSRADYVSRSQRIDWQRLFDEHDLGTLLEDFRNQVADEYDVVLLDSRTGVTDAAGICAVQMPDMLAMVMTANQQSVEGTVEIARRIELARDQLAFDRTKMPILPLLSRFDSREERTLSSKWLSKVADQLGPTYTKWLPEGILPKQVLERTTVPYVGFWSFGEGIPTLEESGTNPETISWSIETIAALIANGLGNVSTLIANRDQFVSAARLRKRYAEFAYDIFLSSPRRDLDFARQLRDVLRSGGAKVFVPEESSDITEGSSLVEDALAASRHLVVIASDELSKWQEHDLRQFLSGLVDRGVDSRVVRLSHGAETVGPASLMSFPSVHVKGDWSEAISRLLAVLGLEPDAPIAPDSSAILDAPLSETALRSYTDWKFPEKPGSARLERLLIRQIDQSRYKTIADIDAVVERTANLLHKYAHAHPELFKFGTDHVTKALGLVDLAFRSRHAFSTQTLEEFRRLESDLDSTRIGHPPN